MLTELITRIEIEARENLKIIESGEGVTSYARFFDVFSTAWNDDCMDAEYAMLFLKTKERYANEMLRMRGHLFLNDIYVMLGLPRTAAGQMVGWIYEDGKIIDFGIYSSYNVDFINGCRREALLDFNVDGIILDKL